jgi:hypothetical protein
MSPGRFIRCSNRYEGGAPKKWSINLTRSKKYAVGLKKELPRSQTKDSLVSVEILGIPGIGTILASIIVTVDTANTSAVAG